MKKLLTILVITIGVFAHEYAVAQSCDTLRNYSLSDDFYEISGTYGAALGHDKVNGGTSNVTQWAEPYSVGSPTNVRRLLFVPWLVHDAGGSVTFNVYSDNAGVPGTVIGSETVPLSDFTENMFYELDFATQVPVNGNFFVGFDLTYNVPQDSFAITGTVKPGGINYTQMFFDGAWDDVDNVYTVNSVPYISAWQLDVLCSNAPSPIAAFNSDAYNACLGSSFNVDGSTSQNTDQYLWFLTGTGATPTYDTDQGVTGTLTPTVTGNNQELILLADGGCRTDGIAYTANVFDPVSATVSTSNTTCGLNNGSINITSPTGGSGTYSYSNNNGSSFQSNPNFTGLASGTYNIRVNSGGNGCSYFETVTVGATPQETITVGADQSICVGETATMTASGTGSIEWFEGTTSLGTGTSIAVSPTTTTTYDAVLTDANNCEDNETVQVTIDPIDDASFTFNDYCNVSPSNGPTAIATPGGTFAFNPVPTDGATIDASTGEISNGVTGTTYTVEYTTNASCPNSSTETVTVQTDDDASFNYNDICLGNGLPIQPTNIATTGGTFSFVTTPTDGATINSGSGVVSGATSGSTYSVQYTTPSGVCQASSTVSVQVFNAPTITISGGQPICEQDNVTLNASGANSYSWNNGLGSGATKVVTPTSTTNYIVTGTDGNGCTNTDNVTVSVNPLPSVDAGSDQVVCDGETVNISASGASSYSWDNGLGAGATQTITATATTTYIVTGTDANNCTNTDQVEITVNPLPTIDAGNDQTICSGDQTTISATGGNTYNWNNGLGVGAAHNIFPSATSTYTVTGTDLNGCENTSQVTVTVNPIPTINAGVNQEVCEGEEVTLTATATNGTITWDNGISNGSPFTATTTTTYTATADDNGCTSTDDLVLTVNPLPLVSVGADQTTCINYAPIQLTGSPAGGIFSGTGVSGSEFDPGTAGVNVHTITYTYQDANGCENSAEQVITVDGCASLNEDNIDKIIVKPNPATEYIDVIVKNAKSIQLITSEGRVVNLSLTSLDDITSRIDVSGLSKGTYILKVNTENNSITRKVIIH
jgi:hypothetical protein